MAWNPVLVGVDGTPESLRAAEVAAKIATAARAPLIPVYAVPLIPTFTDAVGMEPLPVFSPDLQSEIQRSARAQIERALEQVLPPAARKRLEVFTGPAPFILADVARKRKAELVVLGGKQHGALARGLGRSTAHYLVRTLNVPLLVVGHSAASIARVLTTVDLSTASRPTVQAAERLANLFGARLRLLHVVEPLRFTYLAPDQWNEAAYQQRSREIFDQFAGSFKNVAKEDRVVRDGIPAETIAEEARGWRADVIAVGSHGKGWVDRVLVGSTTERLVTELPTSVLVVPVKSMAGGTGPSKESRRRATRPQKGGGKARRHR